MKTSRSGTTTMTQIKTDILSTRQLEYVNKIQLDTTVQVIPDSVPVSNVFAAEHNIFENLLSKPLEISRSRQSIRDRNTRLTSRTNNRVKQTARFSTSGSFTPFITP